MTAGPERVAVGKDAVGMVKASAEARNPQWQCDPEAEYVEKSGRKAGSESDAAEFDHEGSIVALVSVLGKGIEVMSLTVWRRALMVSATSSETCSGTMYAPWVTFAKTSLSDSA
jgi:hypothetical protein